MKQNGKSSAFKVVDEISPSGHRYNITVVMEGGKPRGGTHAGSKKEIDVTTESMNREGRAQRRAKRRLKGRQEGWETAQKSARHAQHKPGAEDRKQ